ncbi:hypothetical protein GUITHDRAFT_72279, partial [Guillardia theta CCMP2712]
QLATVSKEGHAKVRTVVFRGWSDLDLSSSEAFKFITDLRSEKMSHGNIVEVCWYLTETREQFRIAGNLMYITKDAKEEKFVNERISTWKTVSEASQRSYFSPAPGQIVDQTPLVEPAAGALGNQSFPPDSFVVGLVDPFKIDYLHLRSPQVRKIWTKKEQGEWEGQNVNP